MKPIYRFDDIERYFESDESIMELLRNYEPMIKQIELVGQRMRQGKIDNSIENQNARFSLAGIYTQLNKISRMIYAFAQNVHDKAMIKARDEHCKNTPKDEKGKLLPFSSTMAKAEASRVSYQYFRVANYFKAYVDSIEQMSMALSNQSKLQSRFGGRVENDVVESDTEDEELED